MLTHTRTNHPGRGGYMHECFWCDKEFDETLTTKREEEVWLMDEDWNDYQTLRTYYLCPHCNEWSYR